MDFSEANILGQLARVHEQIACMIVAPVNATRNSGLELEAVVQTTEAAASRIMEAAEAISEWLHCGSRDAATLRTIDERVSSIFEACSFQDLTGRAAAMPVPPLAPNMRAVAGPDLGQQEIDRLIGA
jgi:chemotaxis protein CheZ